MKHRSIPELPACERPDEKFLQYGPDALTDAELLAIIMRTGTREETSTELANRILMQTKEESGSILNLFYYDIEDLKKISGIGTVKALQIKSVIELSRRIARTCASEKLSFHDPDSIAGYYMEELRHLDKEQVILILLNSACQMIREEVLSLGTVNAALFSPREIFMDALKYGAVSIVLVHNHPSGDPSPSSKDRHATKRIREAGELIGITLLDHIIVGDRSYISFSKEGIL